MKRTGHDLYLQYMFGYTCAAACRAIDENRANHADRDMRDAWKLGYERGRIDRNNASSDASKLFDYQPSVIKAL